MRIEKDGRSYEVRGKDDAYNVGEGHGYYRKIAQPEPTDRWLDIGGHVGSWTVRIAPEVQSVHAYEPESVNYSLLVENIALNDLANVTPHNAAVVGGESGYAQFYLAKTHRTSTHTIYPKRGRRTTTIPTVNINEALALSDANKLKLDCEGAESEILPAIEDWDSIDELIMEYHFDILKDDDYRIYSLMIELLEEHFPYTHYPKGKNKRWVAIMRAGREPAWAELERARRVGREC